MLASSSTAAKEVRSQADPFLSLIDQQFTFFDKRPMSEILVTIIEKYGGQTDAGFWPDLVCVHPPIYSTGVSSMILLRHCCTIFLVDGW